MTSEKAKQKANKTCLFAVSFVKLTVSNSCQRAPRRRVRPLKRTGLELSPDVDDVDIRKTKQLLVPGALCICPGLGYAPTRTERMPPLH